MASKATTPKHEAKPLSATERKAQVAKAEAEMKKHRPALQAYRSADAKVRKAKQNGRPRSPAREREGQGPQGGAPWRRDALRSSAMACLLSVRDDHTPARPDPSITRGASA
jgi:hypothetical protein